MVAEFPVGKLGMDIEKNCVAKVSGAADLGIKKGWVIFEVNGTPISSD